MLRRLHAIDATRVHHHEVVGGFFCDFEAIRTASRPRCPAQEGPNEEEESDEEEPLDPLPENALQPLKPCRAGKNIDLDEDKEKELEQSDADPLVAMLFRDTDEDAPFFGACFCEDGSLRLPGLEGDGALDDEGQGRRCCLGVELEAFAAPSRAASARRHDAAPSPHLTDLPPRRRPR